MSAGSVEALPGLGAGPGLGPARALARQLFRSGRVRTVGFAYVFAIYAYIQPVGYRHAYTTLASRAAFARGFASNKGLRLFYGQPYDVASVNGYTAWRVGGTLAIVAAVFGLLAAVRAMRAEEESGRMEVVLAGAIGRRTVFAAALVAIAAGVVILWLAEFAGFVVAGLPLGGSAYLALATATVIPVFVGLGAVVGQLAPTSRAALELGSALIVAFLLVRATADTAARVAWLRWLTPLGWAEELRPFSGARPVVLVLPAAATLVSLALASWLGTRRDLGSGVLPSRDERTPSLRGLSSPIAQALRGERAGLAAWAGSVAVFGFVLGVISESVSAAGISTAIQHEIEKLGSGSIATPTGYVAFVFLVFVLALSLFSCAQVGAARREEADERLETLLALPVGRGAWLGGRLLIATGAAAMLALLAGLLTWAGAESVGVRISLARMLEAGANCVPTAALFLGLAALAYAAIPRASAALAYGLVIVTFLWQTVGSLLGAPAWLVAVTPFAHVGLVPTEAFRAEAAAVMVAIGLGAALAALLLFRRRDLAAA